MATAASNDVAAGSLDVHVAVQGMQAAVRSGNMAEAFAIGGRAVVPLNVTPAELKLGKKLAEGAESIVFQARWRDTDVAVKKLRGGTAHDLERFRSELQLLAGFRHPHILPLLGARLLPPDYMLILPLEQYNLRTRLYETAWRPGWEELLDLACGSADAMASVHSAGVLHRDLKPGNLLMSDGGAVQLIDFGIAIPHEDDSGHDVASIKANGKPSGGFHKRGMVGTLEYMAPEVLLKEPASFASDVYSWGVTINELASGTFPFSDCTRDNPDVHTVLEMGYGRQELAAAVAAEGLRPLLPKAHLPPGYADLLERCWARDPAQRPSFEDVRSVLAEMRAALPAWLAEMSSRESSIPAGPMAMDDGDGDGTSLSLVATVSGRDEREANGTTAAAGGGRVAWAVCGNGVGCPPILTAGAFETIGPREEMEDRNIIMPNFCSTSGAAAAAAAAVSGGTAHLLAVFDGHRGSGAADYADRFLPKLLAEACGREATPQAALRAAFLQLDKDYHAVWQRQHQQRAAAGRGGEERFPGCTAVAALIMGGRLYVANAGDSRAVLCRGTTAVALSRDHTAALPDERARIEAAGGRVAFQHNSWRLVGTSGLQITRSLGDFDEKTVGRASGVTAEPEVTETVLTEHDAFLLLASDGLWDVLSNEEAVGLVFDTVKRPDMCGKRLAMEALTRGSNDNITVVVAFLRPVTTLETIFGHGQDRAAYAATPTLYGTRGTVRPQVYSKGASADELRETY